MYQLNETSREELLFMQRYDKEVCTKCQYSAKWSNEMSMCNYIGTEHKKRPCQWRDCVRTGVFKPKKKVKPGTIEKIMEKYGR